MRIIEVTSYYEPNIGGMEKCVQEIAEGLAERGHNITVVTSDIGVPTGQRTKPKQISVEYCSGFIFASSAITPGMLRLLWKAPKDSIFHVHTPRPFTAEAVWLVAKLRRMPYVVHVHGDVRPQGRFGRFLPLYKRLLWKLVIKHADAVIALSPEYRDIMRKEYGAKKVHVIANGVGEEYFVQHSAAHRKLPVILYVGRLADEKNLPRLIEGVHNMKTYAELRLVGEGYKEQELRALASTLGMKNVKFAGTKTGTALLNEYRNADIFSLSSNYEGSPLTALEAMAAGIPVVAADVIGLRELVGKDGILVNPPEPKQFAKAFDKVLASKRLQKELSRRSLNKARAHTWDRVMNDIEKVFADVQRARRMK